MAKLYRLGNSASSANTITKVVGLLNTLSGVEDWAGTFSSNVYTFTSATGEICGVNTFKIGYGTGTSRPQYAYYDEDNDVLIFANASAETSTGDSCYMVGISGFLHDGFYSSYAYSLDKRSNGATIPCGWPNVNTTALLCPFMYEPYNGTSYKNNDIMIKMPGIWVTNNRYHIAPTNKIIDASGQQYISIAWHLFAKADEVEIENL